MAKSDYCIDVGMWAVDSRGSGSPDAILNAIVPELKLIWDGHPTPSVRACNVVMTTQGGEYWGYLPGHPRAETGGHSDLWLQNRSGDLLDPMAATVVVN